MDNNSLLHRVLFVFAAIIIDCGQTFSEEDFPYDLNSLFQLPPNATYPPSWLERCGDGSGNIPLFQQETDNFQQCFRNHLNVSTVTEKFIEALQEEKVPQFMKQKCQKEKPLGECLDNFQKNIERCLDPPQQQDLQTTIKAVKAAMDFICHRDGERVLLFMKDQGIECFSNQQDELSACINNTSAEDFINSTDTTVNIASVTYNEKTCGNIRKVSDCLFHALEQCPKRGPSLVLEALIKTVIKATPCYTSASSHVEVTLIHSIFLALMAVLSLLYVEKISEL